MENKILVFYNNKTYQVITVLIPNETEIDIDEFILERIKYDEHCKDLTIDDISYSIGEVDEYNKALNDYEGGGTVAIDRSTNKHVFTGISKDSITFNNLERAYEFHIEYNTKAISNIYNIDYLEASDIYIDEELYSNEINNNNNYFEARDFNALVTDITENGLYFPFFGYRDSDMKFIVSEGTHRAKAIQSIGGTYMCISKKDSTPFSIIYKQPIEPIFCYEYIGNNSFMKRTIDTLDYPSFLYISNNISLSNEIFQQLDRMPSYKMINKYINLDKILSLDFVRQNKNYYSMSYENTQELYDKFIENKNLFEIKWIPINELNIEELENKDIETTSNQDPFLTFSNISLLQEELIENGMMYPFIVYLKDGKYFVAEGYHRYQALKDINCEVACFVYDFDKIYYRYPSYTEDFNMNIFIPRNIFPYQEYPYVPSLYGFQIIEESDIWYKINITNSIQLIQAYKLMPMVLKHMCNYLDIRHDERIIIQSHVKVNNEEYPQV